MRRQEEYWSDLFTKRELNCRDIYPPKTLEQDPPPPAAGFSTPLLSPSPVLSSRGVYTI